MTSYHQTTTDQGIDMVKEEAKAHSQELIILGMYYTHHRPLTANDVYTIWGNRRQDIGLDVPLLTSIRRAISNLKASKRVEIQSTHKMGSYGKPVHFYAITSQGIDYASKNSLHRFFQTNKPADNSNQLSLF